MPPKAQVTMPLKALVTTISIVATTLGIGGDTSIEDTNSQLVMVGYITDSLSTMLQLLGEESAEAS